MATEALEKKLRLREKRYEVEQLIREKRSEELEALEEVFDKSTLMLVYKLLSHGELSLIHGCIEAGKESRVYLGQDAKGKDVAVKIFLKSTTNFRKGRTIYLEGDYRFQEIRKGTRSLIYLWAQKEFRNLQTAFSVGVTVPKPILVRGNVLVMQFIGERGVSAPLMKDLVTGVTASLYQRLLKEVKLLYRKGELVHADLSEYNVMIWKKKPVMIDMSQAVSISHPLSDVFLRRDLANLNNFFLRNSINVRPIEDLHSWVIGKDAD